MTLKTRIFVRSATLNTLTLLVVVAMHMIYVRDFSDRQFSEEYAKNIVIQAFRAERFVLWDDRAAATALLESIVDNDRHLAYAFIERNSRPFACTFSNGVPRQLLGNAVPETPARLSFSDKHGERYHDIAVRIGGTDAVLHFGHSLKIMHAEALPLLARIGTVGLITTLATLFLSLFIAQRTTREANEAMKALRRSEENLSITLNSIGDAVITTDDAANITRMNPVAEKLTGWAAAEAAGQPLARVFPIVNPETHGSIDCPATRILREGKVTELANSTLLISRDGSERIIADSGAPIRDVTGTVVGAVLVFRDVSEQQRLEERSRRIDKLEAVGQLAGGLAHDFNNLLMGIFGNIELAEIELPPSHPSLTYLQAAHESLDNARLLTGRLLTFAKGGAPVLETVDLRSRICDLVKFHLAGSNVAARFDIPPDLWPVKADKGQIAEVVSNLTVNAKEAMPHGGTLHVHASNMTDMRDTATPELCGNRVKLVFRDEGVGIPPSIIGKIFDPYFTTKRTGCGLGLATVHGIITKHKGHMAVESTPGKGTTFSVFIPADSPEHLPALPEQTPVSEATARVAGRILLMDDDAMILRTTARMIERAGYTVETAADGREAIAKCAEAMKAGKPFDAAIFDLTVPGGMGGKEAIGELLKLAPSVRVIVSSGYSSDPVLSDYVKYGFSGYLAKPFNQQELNASLLRVLKGGDRGATV